MIAVDELMQCNNRITYVDQGLEQTELGKAHLASVIARPDRKASERR